MELSSKQPLNADEDIENAPPIRLASGVQGWSGRLAIKLNDIQKPLLFVLVLSSLLLCALRSPESADDKAPPASMKRASAYAWLLAGFCVCLLGTGVTMKMLADRSRDKFDGDRKLLIAWLLLFTPLLVLEVAFYIMIGWKVILIVGSCCAGSFCLAFIGFLWKIPDEYHVAKGPRRQLLFSSCVAVAAVPPVVTLFWIVGRSGLDAFFATLFRGGARAAHILHFSGFIWALYSLVLLYVLDYFLRVIVRGVSRLVDVSDAVQTRNEQQLDNVFERWKNVYLVGWTFVVLTQIVATIWALPQEVFQLAPSLMMTILAPQIPLIAAHHLMPFRFAAYVANVQLVLLISSIVGLVIALTRGDQGDGLISPVAGGNILATAAAVSVFVFLILLTQVVDYLYQQYANAKREEQRIRLEIYFASLWLPEDEKNKLSGKMRPAPICPECHRKPVDAKNMKCGHTIFCMDCATEIRNHDGEICTTCRKPSYLVQTQSSDTSIGDQVETQSESRFMSCLILERIYRGCVLLRDLCQVQRLLPELKEEQRKLDMKVESRTCNECKQLIEAKHLFAGSRDVSTGQAIPLCISCSVKHVRKALEQARKEDHKATASAIQYKKGVRYSSAASDTSGCLLLESSSCFFEGDVVESLLLNREINKDPNDPQPPTPLSEDEVQLVQGLIGIREGHRFFCKADSCGHLNNFNIEECKKTGELEQTCQVCHLKQCVGCSKLAHPYLACEQVRDGHKKSVLEFKDTVDKHCPICHARVDPRHGDEPHPVECKCGHHFDYTSLKTL